jgi:hypothetical protein
MALAAVFSDVATTTTAAAVSVAATIEPTRLLVGLISMMRCGERAVWQVREEYEDGAVPAPRGDTHTKCEVRHIFKLTSLPFSDPILPGNQHVTTVGST